MAIAARVRLHPLDSGTAVPNDEHGSAVAVLENCAVRYIERRRLAPENEPGFQPIAVSQRRPLRSWRGDVDDDLGALLLHAQRRDLCEGAWLDSPEFAEQCAVAAPALEFHKHARRHTDGVVGQYFGHDFQRRRIADAKQGLARLDDTGAFMQDGQDPAVDRRLDREAVRRCGAIGALKQRRAGVAQALSRDADVGFGRSHLGHGLVALGEGSIELDFGYSASYEVW